MVSCSMGVSKSKLASLAVLWGGEGRGGEGGSCVLVGQTYNRV